MYHRRDTAPANAAQAPTHAPLPADRAFVVQIRADADLVHGDARERIDARGGRGNESLRERRRDLMNRKRIAAAVRVLTVIGVALAATSAHAVTDLEKFQKKLGKIAAIQPGGGIPQKPAGFCVCTNGAAYLHTGYLRQVAFSNYVRIRCETPTFDAAGANTGFVGCDDWLPLSK